MTPSCPIDTQGSLVRAYRPPAQVSKLGSGDRLQVPPPSWLTATTVPDGFSNQLAITCRGSLGSAARDGSAGRISDADSRAQAAATDTAPLMMRGGGKLGSFAFWAPSQPVTSMSVPSAAVTRARIGCMLSDEP